MNYQYWLCYAAQKLSHSDHAKSDAKILLQYVTKQNITYIIAFSETELTFQQEMQLEHLLARRNQGEPIAYLTEEQEFWSLPIKVAPITLIPRTDTECLVEQTLILLSNNHFSSKILDLGTGTGAIALALAVECPTAQIIGIDMSDDIINLAKFNAQKLAISNVTFYQSNWFTSIPLQKFDIIVSNPPYLDKDDLHLNQGDVRFEPKTALISANQGLADIQWIIQNACNYLVNNGWLLIEHGWLQGQQVKYYFCNLNYQHVFTVKDYSGNDRITVGQWQLHQNN